MTQAPTPGPLTAESVKLLVKGDYIRGPNGNIYRLQEWGDGGFLTFIDEPHDGYLVTLCAFIGRPDADGWVKCRFASVPDYLRGIQVEAKTYNDLIRPAQKAENVAWSNMIAFRLAPTALVEASGSERERLARAIDPYAWDDAQYAEPGGKGQQWSQEAARKAADRVLALRPQPSGETREAVLKGVGKVNGDGWKDTTTEGEIVFVWNAEKPTPYAAGQYPRIGNEGWSASTSQYDFTPATANDVPAILALLSARPLALGGQKGEERR